MNYTEISLVKENFLNVPPLRGRRFFCHLMNMSVWSLLPQISFHSSFFKYLFAIFQRLLRVWVVWLRRCEHSEELKLLSLSRKARAHFR